MKSTADKCRSCGKQHVAGFVFCQRCGAPLEAAGDGEYSPINAAPVTLDVGAAARFETAVITLLEDGRKTDALRLYREATGADLGRAAEAIEMLEERIGFVPVSRGMTSNVRSSPGHAVARIVARARAAVRRRFRS